MKIIAILFTLFSSLAISQHTEGEWLDKFDDTWYNGINNPTYANYASTLSLCQSNGGEQEHYYAAWGLEGVLAAFRSTGELKYLDDIIVITNEVIDNSVPVFGGAYLGWPATKTGSVAPNGQPLWESYYWRYIATLLRIIHQSPILRSTSNGDLPGATYQDNYDDILNFLEVNIWNKWTNSGNPNDVYRIRTHMASHWARIGMELHIITGEQKYKDVFDNISWKGFPSNTTNPGASLRNNLNEVGLGYVWDSDWQQTTMQDTDHGSDIINFIVEAVQNGYYWTEADLERFSYQFDNVIWNNDSPVQWNELVDGSGSATGGDVSLHEWINLGRYSQSLQDRIDAAYWRPNPSFPQYSPGGNHAMASGIILLNISDLNGTTVYPEIKQTITLTERKAFPTAEGFGKNTTGGRGGSIIEVTNLNASGAGSLRAALTASGARTIIFRVGGTINLAGAVIDIQNPNVTIAGETAPGGGVLIQNGGIIVSTSNVIFRHIRFRGSAGGNTIQFSIKGSSSLYQFNLDRIILDHCSFSWANDNTITVVNAIDVTIQKSLISQVTKSILAWSNKDLSVLQNISAQSQTRMIETNQALGEYLVYEQINNLSYAFNWAVGHGIGMLGTVENEIFERSNSFSPTTRYPIAFTPINPDYILTSNPAEDTYIYHSGNVIDSYFNGVMDPIGNAYLKSSPLYRSTYVPLPTEGLKSKLLTDTGAGALTLQGLDTVDQDVITHINNKTGTLVTSGTFPTIASGTPYTDSNGDGISDAWATTHGISSATDVKATYIIDGKTIINDAGYTALEIFFADLAGDFERLPLDAPVGVPVITLNGSNPTTLQVGQTYVEPGATATNTSNEVVITGTVNTAVAGTYYRYYNVSNEAGPAIQVTRTVIVQEGPVPTPSTGRGVNKNLFWSM